MKYAFIQRHRQSWPVSVMCEVLGVSLAPDLRSRAETLGQSLPALLAEAEQLAATLMVGEHGRRRAGQGDEFWQYRPAHQGDGLAELVCSNSLRSDDDTASAVGLLHYEMRQADSLIMAAADTARLIEAAP